MSDKLTDEGRNFLQAWAGNNDPAIRCDWCEVWEAGSTLDDVVFLVVYKGGATETVCGWDNLANELGQGLSSEDRDEIADALSEGEYEAAQTILAGPHPR